MENRVLVLTQSFIRHKGDSKSVYLFSLSKKLQSMGMNICVLAPHQRGTASREMIDGIEIHRFRYAPTRFEHLAYKGNMHELVIRKLYNKVLFAVFVASFAVKAIMLGAKKKVELIHAHWWIPSGLIAFVVSTFLRKPYMITTHGTDTFIVEKFKVLQPLAQLVFKRATAVTAVSSPIKAILTDRLGVPEGNIAVFPMPCDLSIFYPISIEKDEGKVILSVGRFVERKGFVYLIEAATLLRERGNNYKLIIVGDGPQEGELKEKIKNLKLDDYAEIVPYMPKAELNKFYNLCDVFVLPSITDWKGEQEGLGLVLLEALSCGKPVIGTRSGGIVDVIEDKKSGLLVPEKDPVALANAIASILNDKALAQRLAEEGRKNVMKKYSLEQTAEKMVRVYRNSILSTPRQTLH